MMMETVKTDSISVLDPIGSAIKKTRQILFRPFDLEKWFVLAFCAWLAALGSGGGMRFNLRPPVGMSHCQPPQAAPLIGQAQSAVVQYLPLVLVIGTASMLVVVALALLAAWVKSRGQFLFLDGIALNRAAITEPWKTYRDEGNALFGFRVLVWLATAGLSLALLIPLLLIGLTLAKTDFQVVHVGRMIAGAMLGLTFLAVCAAHKVVMVLTEDFIVPVMYLRRCGVTTAWKECMQLFSARSGVFALYLLALILAGAVLGLISATVGILAFCCFCCVSWVFLIPLVGGYLFATLILPLHVWRRSYALLFLAQFGPAYDVFNLPQTDVTQ